jgi:hypothetical protein
VNAGLVSLPRRKAPAASDWVTGPASEAIRAAAIGRRLPVDTTWPLMAQRSVDAGVGVGVGAG